MGVEVLEQVEQKTDSALVTRSEKVVNFDPWIYAIHGDRLPLLREDIEKYLAEYLMLTTPRAAIIDHELGFLHESGATYNGLFSRSIDYYRDNLRAKERFQAEWDGFLRAQRLVEAYWEQYNVLPPFIIASPPGDTYDVGEKHSKSVTYVGLAKGFDDKERPLYTLYTIPTAEIEVVKHWQLVESVAEVQTSLGLLSESMGEINANSVVAMPAILQFVEESADKMNKTLDEIAKALGLESWEKIVKDSEVSNLIDGQYDRTVKRRKAMVDWVVELIQRLVADGRSRTEFEVIPETLRQVFSAERGGKYVEAKYEDVEEVLTEMESLYVGNGGDAKYANRFMEKAVKKEVERYSVTDWYGYNHEEIAYLIARRGREAMLGWIGGNADAYDSYVGTGCGGSMSRDFDKFGIQDSKTSYAGFDVRQSYGYQSEWAGTSVDSSVSESSSTGKYKEYYDYKPGICAHCHEHKPYVAHPKSSETQCAGWCSDCEK